MIDQDTISMSDGHSFSVDHDKYHTRIEPLQKVSYKRLITANFA